MIDIDRIARQIVDAEPSTDLEARIRARLDAEPTPALAKSGGWTRWAAVGGLVGAAAVVSLLVAVGTPVEVDGPGVVTSVGVQGSRRPEVVAPVEVVESAGPEVVPTAAILEARRPAVKVAELSAEESAWFERRIPALEPVDELRVDFLAYESIQPEELSIAPLIMTALPTDGAEIERQQHR